MSTDGVHSVAEGSLNNEVSPLIAKATYSNAVENLTPYALFVAGSLALGSFQFGYHIGELNTPQDVISCISVPKNPEAVFSLPPCIPMSETQFAFAASIFIVGGLIGNLVAADLTSYFGRKKTLVYNTAFHIVGTLLLGLSYDILSLYTGRFLVGIGCGISIVVVPVYLIEIAPSSYRGLFGVFHQIGVVGGILVSQILGLFFSNVPGWRFILSFCLIISAIQLVTFPFIVCSPRHLFTLPNGAEAARAALSKLRGTDDIEHILADWEKEDSRVETGKVSFYQIFTQSTYVRPLQILFLVHFTQQFSGINSVMNYSTPILRASFPETAKYITVLINVGNFVLTLLSGYIIERIPRRQLFFISTALTGLSCATLSFALYFNYNYLAVVAIISVVASFAVGLGPLPFIIPMEIFNTQAAATASSLGLIANNAGSFIVVSIFFTLQNWFGSGAFLVFAVYLLFAFIVSYKILPETKGKSPEAIASEWL
ncbi:sugar transporter [Basidiobolus meristosporus CBS 931.73]|uniref:Sugar transporter n=1 Tax=Basidiobolus meristosporus CBS 931.73 TaxID=1314790 RepID=A0A1Y1Y267_9FUNG|nr:sugar transporter [Basidiobolus meristosporus CBS 931.73]|eukprot:ORX92107.1 sugar transporter [Basidiobolus meristosporus CBS 931.73]